MVKSCTIDSFESTFTLYCSRVPDILKKHQIAITKFKLYVHPARIHKIGDDFTLENLEKFKSWGYNFMDEEYHVFNPKEILQVPGDPNSIYVTDMMHPKEEDKAFTHHSRVLKLSKSFEKLDHLSATAIYTFKLEICPLKDTLMLIDPEWFRIYGTDNQLSMMEYFNRQQYEFSPDSKFSFKCLNDADQLIISITKMYDKSNPKSRKKPVYFGIFLFQGKFFDRLTDRMVFKEIYDQSAKGVDLKSIHFANNLYKNDHYLLIN